MTLFRGNKGTGLLCGLLLLSAIPGGKAELKNLKLKVIDKKLKCFMEQMEQKNQMEIRGENAAL